MKKSTLILIAAVFLVLGGVGGYLFISSRNKGTQPKTSSSLEETKVKGDLTYKDESGFSFAYPKGIKVTDITPDDEAYYSQLKLAKAGEFLTISVKDAKTSGYENSKLVGAVSLAGMPAKQYVQGEKLATVAIDSGVIYLIEGPKDGDYWEGVQNTVAVSFTLQQKAANDGSGSSDNAIYEEEEVVE